MRLSSIYKLLKWYQIRWAQKDWGKESRDLINCQLGRDTHKVVPLVGKTNGAAFHGGGGGSPKKSISLGYREAKQ